MRRTYVLRSEEIRKNLLVFIDKLSLEKKWQIVIEPYRKKRSYNQNNLMWAWNTEIANETGHTPEEIHDYLKLKFLPHVVVGHDQIEVPGTTANLSTMDFSQYLEQVRAWAATDLGLMLSSPEDL